jgi:hypothetical protein
MPLLSFCQIINIPADYSTIQQGIDNANDGDTVLVADATYFENINFNGKHITLASHFIIDQDTTHISNTIIDGSQPNHPDTACVVLFNAGEDTTSILQGFTITGGTGLYSSYFQGRIGGGIVCWNAGAKILNNLITDNHLTSNYQAFGGGIAVGKTAGERWIVIENNNISNNYVEASEEEAMGGGIYTTDNVRICSNIIEYNSVNCDDSYARGGGISCYSSHEMGEYLVCTNNSINNNYLNGYVTHGGGIRTYKFNVDLYDNQLRNNSCTATYRCYGSGMVVGQLPSLFVAKRNIFSENIGPTNINTGAGGGLSFAYGYEAEIIIEENQFLNNTAQFGGGFYAKHTYNILLSNNLFANNNSVKGGAINIFHNVVKFKELNKNGSTSLPAIINNTFYNNYAEEVGGAIRYTGETGEGLITFNNIFWLNDAGSSGNAIYNETPDDSIYVFHSNINHENIYGLWSGNQNMNNDPDFIDPIGGDFHISLSSPCAGRGIDSLEVLNEIYYCPSIDIDADPRPLPDGTSPDMGIDEIEQPPQGLASSYDNHESIFIYPNPSNTNISVVLSALPSTITLLTISNTNGQQLITHLIIESKTEIDIKHLPAGIYIIKVWNDNDVMIRKVIKK